VVENRYHVIDNRSDATAWVEVVDDSGSVRVQLTGATIVERTSLTETFEKPHADKGFLGSLLGRGDGPTGRYRHTERIVAIGDQLSVSDEATFNEETDVLRQFMAVSEAYPAHGAGHFREFGWPDSPTPVALI